MGGGEDDVGEGMQCSDHPYRNNPGGICAFCLQEKLGKLVSSSFPNAIFPSSSSSSPSFRSEIGVGVGGGGGVASSTSLSVRPISSSSSSYSASKDCHYHGNHSRRARIPFLLAQKKKKKKEVMGSDGVGIVLKRSKSTTTPRRRHFLVESEDADDYSPQKRGFWSFLYLSKSTAASRKMEKGVVRNAVTPAAAVRESNKLTPAITQTHPPFSHKPHKDSSSLAAKKEEFVDESDSPNNHASASASSFGRKVSRSRSVGCGSRSFSGDLFERISTGFGDCTLRRVESQREGKPKSSGGHRSCAPGAGGPDHQCIIKERVKCGGIFGGFIITSSSSSSSSSSYWISSSVEDNKSTAAAAAGPLSHGRSKSWGWAFASPMRALSKPSSSKVEHKDAAGKRDINAPNKPNLAAIPSLLAVRG